MDLFDRPALPDGICGRASLREMYRDSMTALDDTGKPQIWLVVGRPGSGKSDLSAEILQTRYLQLLHEGTTPAERRARIFSVRYDEALQETRRMGFMREPSPASKKTEDYYGMGDTLCVEKILQVLEPERLVVVEAPGVAERGDTILTMVAERAANFNDVDYDLYTVWVTAGDELTNLILNKRSDLGDPIIFPKHPDALDDRNRLTDGGDVEAFNRFTQALHDELLLDHLIRRPALWPEFNPEMFTSPDLVAEYIEKTYSNHVLHEQLHIPHEHIFVGRNKINPDQYKAIPNLGAFVAYSAFNQSR